MGFVWTNSISSGAAVLTAAAQEIRDNADWIDDNKGDYCATHNSTVDTTDKIGQDGTYNSTVDTTDKIGQDTSYRVTVNSGVNSGVNSTYYVSNLAANWGKS